MTTHHDHDDNLTRGLDHTGAPRLAAAIRSVRAPYAADPKPWAEGTWPTAAQLDDWIRAHPAGDPNVHLSLAALLAAADRGTRCLDADHAADLALLDRIADDLVAARDRVRRLEATHPADRPGSLDADQAAE